MATPITPDQLLRALRAEGITNIVEMAGWRTHNRDEETGKIFGPVHGIVIHHTAGVGPGMASFCRSGTANLPGPLCHAFLAKDGTLYLVGHGRANHAGTTTQRVKDAMVLDVEPGNQRHMGAETADANDFTYGLEIENKGDGKDPYPMAQYNVAVKWASALARFHKWSENSVWGHKEITTRKIDPSFGMPLFRSAVGAQLDKVLTAASSTPTTTTGTRTMNFVSLAKVNDPETILPGGSETLYWTTEYQDGTGDHGAGGKTVVSGEHFTGTVALVFSQPVPAGVVVRAVHELDAGGQSDDYSVQLVAGLTNHVYPYTARIGEDRNLVFEIENDSSSSITLTWAAVRGFTEAL